MIISQNNFNIKLIRTDSFDSSFSTAVRIFVSEVNDKHFWFYMRFQYQKIQLRKRFNTKRWNNKDVKLSIYVLI